MQARMDLLKENYGQEEINKIALPMNDGLLFVDVREIILLEADGSYTHVFLKNSSKVLVSKKIKFFEDLLEKRPTFFRPHRSFMINLNFMKKYLKGEGVIVMDNLVEVSLSRDKMAEFESALKDFNFIQ